jgi:alpha-D-ribose 1-methylphosphonate 5-triphosphate synthase subunit PhnH
MLTAAFVDPVSSAQATFRAILDAMARPGSLRPLTVSLSAPPPMNRGAAAVALTLCDQDTPVWLDAELRASARVCEWLRFHCGCPLVEEPEQAAFAFVSRAADVPAFEDFNIGTADYPDRSTTVVLQVKTLSSAPGLVLTGPGIRDARTLNAELLPNDMVRRLARNRSLFPRGVDLILATQDAVAALPRSVRVLEET